MKNAKFLALFLALTLLCYFVASPQNMIMVNDRPIAELYSSDSKTEEVSVKKNYKRMVEPVVVIYTLSGSQVQSSGTAFGIAYDKKADETYFLSNDHICSMPILGITFVGEKLNDSQASFRYDGKPDMQMTVVDKDPANDLCLLKADGSHPIVKIDKDTKLDVAEKLYIVGAPNSNAPIILETFFSGYVPRSQLGSLGEGEQGALMVSEMLQPGHSGSPIYNKRGELVGISFASSVRDRVGQNSVMFSYGGLGIGMPDILIFLERNNIK